MMTLLAAWSRVVAGVGEGDWPLARVSAARDLCRASIARISGVQ